MIIHFNISEVDGLLDPEECDLLVAIAKGKNMKRLHQQFLPSDVKNAERLLRDWDYDQDGYISHEEVCSFFADSHKIW